jgi:5-methylcytosine-specific restriction endonuclease McrA
LPRIITLRIEAGGNARNDRDVGQFMTKFLAKQPTTDDYWRGIVLLGRNVASYKFALAKSLLELSAQGKSFVRLEELAKPYTRHLAEHLKKSDKQITSRSSRFLDICRGFNRNEKSESDLVEAGVRLGFANVIDAFHVVNNGTVPERFFVDDREAKGGITITDATFKLGGGSQAANFPSEVEARWRLVETAWSLSLPPALLSVEYDQTDESLFINPRGHRIGITGCRDALNGYQKGKCFYCSKNTVIGRAEPNGVDVDHLHPLALSQFGEFSRLNLNGVWNLVLACAGCNRGDGGKFMRAPALKYLERLHHRNEFLIESHHPLRETLMNQTGANPLLRRQFLQETWNVALKRLLHIWECQNEQPAAL